MGASPSNDFKKDLSRVRCCGAQLYEYQGEQEDAQGTVSTEGGEPGSDLDEDRLSEEEDDDDDRFTRIDDDDVDFEDPEFKCQHCGESFNEDDRGEIYMLDDLFFHSGHFVCCHCGKDLVEKTEDKDDYPVVYRDRLWCHRDYSRAMKQVHRRKKCAECGRKFKDGQTVHRAVNRNWHSKCLRCTVCRAKLAGQPVYFTPPKFHRGDPLFCKKHFIEKYNDRCAGCAEPLDGEVVKAGPKVRYHARCFVCAECDNPIEGKFCFKDGFLYCKTDFDEKFSVQCAICNNKVEGKFNKAMDKVYHYDCFRCGTCGDHLGTGMGLRVWLLCGT